MDADAAPIAIVLADDHVVVRRGLRMLLEREPGIEVVAEAGDADEAVSEAATHRPSVLVLDLNMPGPPPLGALGRLRAEAPGTAVVVLTMEQDPAFARRALDEGAAAYVLKQAADEELVAAIRTAAQGGEHISAEIRARLAAASATPSGPPGGLSEREVEVLRLIALGHTNPEIGERLEISVRTVETHRSHVQQKLGLTTRPELVRWAFSHDLVPERHRDRRP